MSSNPDTPQDSEMPTDVSIILQRIGDGDRKASEDLLPVVYAELRDLARARIAHERIGHTLQPTALVHEAYLRLVGNNDQSHPAWDHRGHFFAAAAEAMRRVLIDHARTKGRQKRGGDRSRIPLSVIDVAESWDFQETIELDDAIEQLKQAHPEAGEVVRLRFFAGLSVEETAETTGLSTATVKRRWELGRAWLYRKLEMGREAT